MDAMESNPHYARTVITFTPDGTEVTIPASDVEDWQYEVANLDTYRGLADWDLARREYEKEEG